VVFVLAMVAAWERYSLGARMKTEESRSWRKIWPGAVWTRVTATLILVTGPALGASTSDTQDLDEVRRLKDANVRGVHDPQPQVGGENVGNAVPIPSLPFSDSGNTCAFLDDYDEVCPFTGSTSPDVVYSYSPDAFIEVDIDLCDSDYDTKTYVYENSVDNLVACNDDYCGYDGFRSHLAWVPMSPGNTYYIVVDGYFGDCGTYDFTLTESGPCDFLCPFGLVEGEPDCGDGYVDEFNAGCNNVPHRVSEIACGLGDGEVTICGKYGGFFDPKSGEERRDTDWYTAWEEINNGFTFCVTGEYSTLVGFLNADLGCGAPIFEDSRIEDPCERGCFDIPAGNWWLFVATSGFGAAAGTCGGDYLIEIEDLLCHVDLPVESSSWGTIKGRYAGGSHDGAP
jgi:hypothetical protein